MRYQEITFVEVCLRHRGSDTVIDQARFSWNRTKYISKLEKITKDFEIIVLNTIGRQS